MKRNKGITLIALVITIIVMLILVGVTINLAMQGGLFDTAREAAQKTEIADIIQQIQSDIVVEQANNSGKITEEKLNEILNKYGTVSGEGENKILTTTEKGYEIKVSDIFGGTTSSGELEPSTGWVERTKPEGWDNDKIIAVTDGTDTVPLPEGYEISKEEGENTVAGGLVIKDSKNNEFVWIPVTGDFVPSYSYGSNYLEPKELTYNDGNSGKPYDSQETLNYYYGTKEDGSSPFYNYATDFAYTTHYAEMIESVNKYNGFYIGRYETTLDENKQIGSKVNTTVLTADKSIPQTNNKQCIWWGLYNVQRNSNVVGNKEYLQTNMIWGQQWDAMLKFLGDEQANSTIEGSQSKVLKSGEATYENGLKDKMNNIYDLRRNGWEWTAEASNTSYRVLRGGVSNGSLSASNRYGNYYPVYPDSTACARLTLYIR